MKLRTILISCGLFSVILSAVAAYTCFLDADYIGAVLLVFMAQIVLIMTIQKIQSPK